MTEARGPVEEARRLEVEGYEAFKQGDVDGSRDLNERSLALAREAQDFEAIGSALSGSPGPVFPEGPPTADLCQPHW